jgi:hypothetical protein
MPPFAKGLIITRSIKISVEMKNYLGILHFLLVLQTAKRYRSYNHRSFCDGSKEIRLPQSISSNLT